MRLEMPNSPFSLDTKLASFVYRSIEFVAMNVGASHKVTMTLDYRRRWQSFLPQFPGKQSLWIHGASVGELEDLAAFYGNPELLKIAGYTPEQLVLTSSSPSAEEFLLKIKDRLKPLYAGPLPPDVLPRVEEFFSRLNPELLILSQSDTWPVLMRVAQKRLKKGAIWLPHKNNSASWSKKRFLAPLVKKIGLRQKESLNPLPEIPAAFVGSPRVDRILQRKESSLSQAHPLQKEMESASGKIRILMASAWKEDAEVMRQALNSIRAEDQKKFEVFAIPHDTHHPGEVTAISAYLGKNVFLTEGLLLESLRDFDLAMVGGAFRTGLHNIIEPLAWGIPTFCGPDLKKQPEAVFFQEQGALKSVSNSTELKALLLEFADGSAAKQIWKQKANDAKDMLIAQRGASQRLAELIAKLQRSSLS